MLAESSAGSAQIRTAGAGGGKAPGTGSIPGVTVGAGTGTLSVTAKLGSADVTIA